MSATLHLSYFIILFFLGSFFAVPVISDLPGKWELLLRDAGVASMHTAVTRFGTVILLDRMHNNATTIRLSDDKCSLVKVGGNTDCYVHSVLYDPITNTIRPLAIQTDTWCSSGQFLPDGSLLQTGGGNEGIHKMRRFWPCNRAGLCDWVELKGELLFGRWYATNQLLPDGRVIVVGGANVMNVEFYPPAKSGAFELTFLRETNDSQNDNLYPYVHLIPDGNLFIFANSRAILYDYRLNVVVHAYPELEGGPRNYPSAGSSVMLPISSADGFTKAEVVVCGGAAAGAGVFVTNGIMPPAKSSCGRIVATDRNAMWQMEDMPTGRIMGDMVLLPTGDVLIINGASVGAQGFGMAAKPILNPVLYRPDADAGLRFMVLTPSTIPRMYHSTAVLLPDARVLVAGSNTYNDYTFDVEFPTELRLEAFSPEYLSSDRANLRPRMLSWPSLVHYGEKFYVSVETKIPVVGVVEMNLASTPFCTHSFSQGQRLVKLDVSSAIPVVPRGRRLRYNITCTAPPSPKVAPPSYYMMFGVNQGVPSVSRWVRLVS